MSSAMFLEKLSAAFNQRGFEVQRQFKIPKSDLTADIYARNKHLYYFIYDLETTMQNRMDEIVVMHKVVNRYVNSLYKIPKAFRFAIPIMSSVVLTMKTIPENENMDWIRSEAMSGYMQSVVGGEANGFFLLDAEKRALSELKWFEFNSALPVLRAKDVLQGVFKAA